MQKRFENLLVPFDKLRPSLETDWATFKSTKRLKPLEMPIGQERALAALEVGLGMKDFGFHVFVSGAAGTGRTFGVRKMLAKLASGRPVPSDCCYLYNFSDPYRPLAVLLPPGRGRELAHDLEKLIKECRTEIPKAFDSDPYRKRRDDIHEKFDEERQRVVSAGVTRARDLGFDVQIGPSGFALVALHEGKPMSVEEVGKLPEKEQKALDERAGHARDQVEKTLDGVRKLQKEENAKQSELISEVASFSVGHLIDELRESYHDLPRIQRHIEDIRVDLMRHFQDFLEQESGPETALFSETQRERVFRRYRVNVLVDNGKTKNAPVIFESNPTYYNLTGKIDYQAEFGTMVTDFTLIKAGALQRANGGYLILDALDVLASPLAWQALTRALQAGEATIENLAEQYGLVPSTTLKPEAVPLSVQVVLIGEPRLFRILQAVDKNFRELFRIKAEFDTETRRSPETAHAYACHLAALSKERGLRHFDADAVSRIVEHGSRLAEHQRKVSTRMIDISDLASEASYWAEHENSVLVGAAHVEKAIEEHDKRSKLLEDKLHEQITEDTLLIDVQGEAVGQMNGLSVYDLGDYAFARPVRVTARTSLGAQGIVDIEREAELSGKIHSKGVLILGSYLAHKFAQDKPLALSASLTFEQSYGEVEGDSASVAELCALLSSLAGLPIRQGIAATGSMNQLGVVQPVGGITLKIEGFFQVCADRGLTGDQGVIIPEANLKHLALKEPVVQAVREGKFHVWSVKSVDEAIEILTGVQAGTLDVNGRYPDDSVNGHVDLRLRRYAERLKEFAVPPQRPPVKRPRQPVVPMAAK